MAPSHLLSWFLCLGQSQARLSGSRAEAVDRAIPAEATLPSPLPQKPGEGTSGSQSPGWPPCPCLPLPRASALPSLSKHCRWPLAGTLGRLPYTGRNVTLTLCPAVTLRQDTKAPRVQGLVPAPSASGQGARVPEPSDPKPTVFPPRPASQRCAPPWVLRGQWRWSRMEQPAEWPSCPAAAEDWAASRDGQASASLPPREHESPSGVLSVSALRGGLVPLGQPGLRAKVSPGTLMISPGIISKATHGFPLGGGLSGPVHRCGSATWPRLHPM